MDMKKALAFIKQFEGLHDGDPDTPALEPMRCPAGYWTLGWGSRFDLEGREVTADTPAITMEQAELLLARDFGKALDGAARFSHPVNLEFHQAVAIASFIYNLGALRYAKSDLRRYVLAGDFAYVPLGFANWVKADGKPLLGLGIRRALEAALFLTGRTV